MKNLQLKQIISPIADVRKNPDSNSELETQCLLGENVKLLDEFKNWLHCKCELDNYVGWIKKQNIGAVRNVSLKIKSILTHVYKEPNIKSKVVCVLYFNSKICIEKKFDEWVSIKINNQIGFVKKIHTKLLEDFDKHWIDSAMSFKGAPYQWGGKSFIGIDCSGLVQITLESSGIKIPRNTDDQLNFKSDKVITTSKIQKGSLIFWKGHVAIAIKKNMILHSNAFHMSVQIESLEHAIKRIKKSYGDILGVKKILY